MWSDWLSRQIIWSYLWDMQIKWINIFISPCLVYLIYQPLPLTSEQFSEQVIAWEDPTDLITSISEADNVLRWLLLSTCRSWNASIFCDQIWWLCSKPWLVKLPWLPPPEQELHCYGKAWWEAESRGWRDFVRLRGLHTKIVRYHVFGIFEICTLIWSANNNLPSCRWTWAKAQKIWISNPVLDP